MSVIAGAAIIKLAADVNSLKKDLKGAESAITDSLGKASSAGRLAAKGALATAATIASASTVLVTKLADKAVELYGAYEQSIGGVETLFGEAADTVIANSERAFETAGISANEYLEQATTFSATLIRNLGGDTQRAAELTDMAIQDMADNVNKLGTDMTMVQNAYAGLARGNATMLDNLRIGYAGTQKEALQLAKDMGVVGEEVQSFADLGFDKSIEAIHKLQVELGITGTTAEEAANTIQGSQKAFKAAAQDFIRGLADPNADVQKLLENLMDTAVNFGKNFATTLLRALPNIAKGLDKLVKAIGEILPEIVPEIVPAFTDAVLNVMTTLIELAPTLTDAFIKGITGIITSIAAALPRLLTSIVNAVLGIVNTLLQPENLKLILQAGIALFMGLVQALPEVIKAILAAMPEIMRTLTAIITDPEFIQMMLEAGVQLFMAVVHAVPEILGALIESWKQVISDLWNSIKTSFVGFAANFGAGISNAIVNGLNKMIEFVEKALNAPINAINGALDAINKIPGVNISHISTIQFGRIPQVAMAAGGIVTRPTTALIGEAGPEAVIPLQNSTNWAKAIAGALSQEFASEELTGGRTVNIYMTNEINNKLDINEISRELVTSIRRAI